MIRPKRYLINAAGHEMQLGDRTLIMGVINVTPDSFSDGGRYMEPERALERALELEEQGADIIDIGAESTRPGSERISEAEELHRLIPVLKKLKDRLAIPISVDTYKAAVAERALANGAAIINDPTTLTFDTELGKVVAAANAVLILNHMRGTPETWAKLSNLAQPMRAVMEDLDAGISRARRAGIDRARIIVDPGLGFGKRGEQNYELIARLGEMQSFDLPILVGPSRKSFLGQKETAEADRATAGAVTAAVLHGAHIVRVHDVAAIRPVLQTADGILRSLSEEPVEAKPVKAAAPSRALPPPSQGRPLRPPTPAAKQPEPAREPFGDRTPPARQDYGGDRPPRRFDRGEAPPKRFDRDDRPARPPRQFDRSGEAPPKRFSREDRGGPPQRYGKPDEAPKRYSREDRPPRDREQGDRPARPPFKRAFSDQREGGRPPAKRAFGDRQEGGAPAKRPFGPRKEGPPAKRAFGDRSEGGRPPTKRAFSDRGEGRPPAKRAFGDRKEGARPPFKRGGRPPGAGGAGGFKGKRPPGRPPRPRRED